MATRFLIFVFLLISANAVGGDYLDSLNTRLILVNNDEKLEILDELIPYYFRNDPLQASKKAGKMLSIARQTGNKTFEIKAQRYIGLADSYLTSDYEKALEKCRIAEKNARANGFIEELILTKLAYSDIFRQIGDYSKSLNYQIDAWHLADSINNQALLPMILIEQAKNHIMLNEPEQARLDLKKALKRAKLFDQQEYIAQTHMIFGDLYIKSFNHDLARQHYRQAFDIYKTLRKDIQQAIVLFKIGESFFNEEALDSALIYNIKALKIRRKINDLTGLAESFNKIGLILNENGEYERAIRNIKIGLSYAEKINSNVLMRQSFDYLYNAFLNLRDYKKAAYYKNKYAEISELIFAEASEKKVEEINSRFMLREKEQEIEQLEAQNRLREAQLAASRKFNIAIAAIMFLMIISAVIFTRSYREKKRINSKLQEVNAQIIKQNEQLKELNSTKDKFFSIIGHDLKGPLNSLTSFSQLLINHTASLTEEEIRTIAKDLDKSLKNLYELLENLLGWARSQTGRLEFKPEKFRIAEVIRENVQLLKKAALNKKIKVELTVDDEVHVFADKNSVRTVVRNLISNAIKFTNEEGVITIFVDEWKDNVEIGVHDTGVGMPPEIREKIFDISAKHSTLGTNNEKGTGLGLILCKEFVERNNGHISVESEVNTGSTFKFTLPKDKTFQKASEKDELIEA